MPSYDPHGYQTFYAEYPCHRDQDDAVRAWDHLRPDAELQQTILADIRARQAGDQKWADGYIVYPGRYLRGKRWRDDLTPIAARASPTSRSALTQAQYDAQLAEVKQRLSEETSR